ncbi:MAG: YraN family protein [Leptonema sp. (in: bacteria)]
MGKNLLGKMAEDLAVQFLQKNGYQIIDRNWRLENFGEIDIIAKKRKIFNFNNIKFLVDRHFSGKEDHGYRIFALLVLELWFRIFVEKEIKIL